MELISCLRLRVSASSKYPSSIANQIELAKHTTENDTRKDVAAKESDTSSLLSSSTNLATIVRSPGRMSTSVAPLSFVKLGFYGKV